MLSLDNVTLSIDPNTAGPFKFSISAETDSLVKGDKAFSIEVIDPDAGKEKKEAYIVPINDPPGFAEGTKLLHNIEVTNGTNGALDDASDYVWTSPTVTDLQGDEFKITVEEAEKYESFMSTSFQDDKFTITVKRTEINKDTIEEAKFRVFFKDT